MSDVTDAKEWMRRLVESSGSKIAKSRIYCGIFTDNFKQSPQCALELGLAILMGKPIRLLVDKGTKVPAVLEKLAERIEYYDPTDMATFQAASERLFAKEPA